MDKSYARISCLLNRDANIAVLLRRGPSKWTQMILWDLEKDIFKLGQWFHGSVHVDKSDISPNGKYVALSLAKYHLPEQDSNKKYSWTAIAKPPYFTGLMTIIAKEGQSAGGYFVDNNRFNYNGESVNEEVEEYSKNSLELSFNRVAVTMSIFGENPLNNERLAKIGWNTLQGWKGTHQKTVSPEIKEKRIHQKASLILHRQVEKHKIISKYFVRVEDRTEEITDADWVDLDAKNRLLVARQGKIFRSKNYHYLDVEKNLELVSDFDKNVPEEVQVPSTYFD